MDYTYFTTVLEKEREKLEGELNRLGARDPQDSENWDVKRADMDIMDADENEAADRTEEFHLDAIVLDELEARYRDVVRAQKKLELGTYGMCEVSGEQIEEERLHANPAARTCKAHIGEEEKLAP